MSVCIHEASHVEDHLRQALNYRVGDFHLEVQQDGVILEGKTSSYHAKQLAQHLAMAATNLPILANKIEVEPAHYRAGSELLITD